MYHDDSRFFAVNYKIMYKKIMMKTDITIIGAGVVGLAVASEIARPDLNVIILEKNARHGEGISSRNSEVIHSGIYYEQGSLKASLCAAGREMIYEIASKNNVPHKKTGKLIVATDTDEIATIEKIYEKGRNNGVKSISLISKGQIARMEPYVQGQAAIYSPDTGIISAHDLMNYFMLKALDRKASLVCRTKVTNIEKDKNCWRITTQNETGENFEILSSLVINAAGLESDTIANLAGMNYQLHYCKGNYFSISGIKRGMVQRLIYPVPDKNRVSLGVHLTIDLNGRLKLGPDADYIPRSENYSVDSQKSLLFFQGAQKFLPLLKEENLSPDMAGIRPKLQGPKDDLRDFVIQEDFPGFINLVGIESPGLTASPAIALHVKNILHLKG